jgi:hypothetical protein
MPILVVMKPSEKTRNDLERSLAEAGKLPDSARAAHFRACVERYFGFLPQTAREDIIQSFAARHAKDAGSAVGWLLVVAGIFLQDYDGSPLPDDDWRELRDILSEGSGELNMDILSYAMTLVVEHKAL